MSTENEPRVERTVVEQPAVIRREEVRVREGGGATGWWIATIVAVVAVMGLIFVYANRPGDADLQAAQDAGRAQAAVENAAAQAQSAAQSASAASANAADSMARSTQAAAASAGASADRAAQAADSAATTASNAASNAAAEAAPENPQ